MIEKRGGEVKNLENLQSSFMGATFCRCNNLPHHSHPACTLLDQFLHLIPTEKTKCFMNTYNFPKKSIFPYKKSLDNY